MFGNVSSADELSECTSPTAFYESVQEFNDSNPTLPPVALISEELIDGSLYQYYYAIGNPDVLVIKYTDGCMEAAMAVPADEILEPVYEAQLS